jgi:hypothetical protein
VVIHMAPYIPNFRMILAVHSAPTRPPIVKIAVMIEYLFELIPKQCGRDDEDDGVVVSLHVRDGSGKLSSEIWYPSRRTV